MTILTRIFRRPSPVLVRIAGLALVLCWTFQAGCTRHFAGFPSATAWNACLDDTDEILTDCPCGRAHDTDAPRDGHLDLPADAAQALDEDTEAFADTTREHSVDVSDTSDEPAPAATTERTATLPETTPLHPPTPASRTLAPTADSTTVPVAVQPESRLQEILSTDLWLYNDNLREDGRPGKLAENFHRRHFDKAAHLNNAKRGDVPQAPKEYSESVLSHYRWYHRDIEKLEAPFHDTLDKQDGGTPENLENAAPADPEAVRLAQALEPFLRNRDATLRCNAAILRLRLRAHVPAVAGTNRAKLVLLASVADSTLSPGQRAAAMETLGRDRDTVSDAELAALSGVLRESPNKPERTNTQNDVDVSLPPRLHVEFLHALGKRVSPWENDAFRTALDHPVKEIRLETLRHWKKAATPGLRTLPPEIYVLARSEPETAVYIEVLQTLAAWRDPATTEILRTAGQHPYVDVRCAALEAFGQIGGEEAARQLREGTRNNVPRVRAAALRGLRHAGAYGEIYRFSGDKSVEVRTEVARALGDRLEPKSLEIAKKYCNDISAAVLRETTASLEQWPLEVVGPLLLDMLSARSPTARNLARDTLVRSWPPAKTVLDNALADPLSDPVAELRKRFDAEHPRSETLTLSPAAAWGEADRERLRDATADLSARDLMLRQRGAATILAEANVVPLPPETLLAVCHAVCGAVPDAGSGEDDPIVLTRVLSALAVKHETAPSRPVETVAAMGRLAMAGLEHPNVEVRKKACLLLGTLGDFESGPASLSAALHDPHPDVVRAAISGFGMLPVETLQARKCLEDVRRELAALQRHASPSVRIDAALEGFLLGDSGARAMLTLLAASREDSVRLYLARRLGETAEETGETFVPEMLRFLDDKSAFRRIALEALPIMCGHAPGNTLSPTEQAEYWKRRVGERTSAGKSVLPERR